MAAYRALRERHTLLEICRQPELAATLARLAADPADFYRGRTAELLLAQQANRIRDM